jgi:predicted kinase
MSDATTPTLVLLAGWPGAGKSTVARGLGAALGWPVVDKDTIKSTLLEYGLAEAVAAPLAYEVGMALVEDLVARQRRSTLFDSPARFPRTLAGATRIAAAASGRLRVVLCQAEAPVRHARLAARIPLRSQWTADHGPPGDGAAAYAHLPPDALMLDTTRPPADLVAEALAWLAAQAPAPTTAAGERAGSGA